MSTLLNFVAVGAEPQWGRIVAIAAMARNRVIGHQGRLPWHLPEDFQWFKSLTTGHLLLMGRKTFESIGRPLPNRQTVVLSRHGPVPPEVRVIRELGELDVAQEQRRVFVCGGAQVYALALPYCTDLLLTRVFREVAGDVCFPDFEDRFQQVAVVKVTPDFEVVHYRNRAPQPWPCRPGVMVAAGAGV